LYDLYVYQGGNGMSKPFVLCIAAWSGGGKTTVVHELLKRLPCSEAIYFDSYPIDFLKQDYYQWSVNGNDYNEWHLEAIADDIEKLLRESLDYILLELPMGYANDMIAKYIDYTVFLDVPLDILLARTVIRDYCRRDPERRKLDSPLESLAERLTNYITHYRATVFNYIDKVKPSADYIVDGYRSAEEIAGDIINQLNTTSPHYINDKDMRDIVKRGYQEGDYYALYGVRKQPLDWQTQILKRFVDLLDAGSAVIDWGAGTGDPHDRWLSQQGMKIIAVENSAKHIRQGIGNLPEITWIYGDFTTFTWAKESYDGLIMLYSLLHIPRTEQAALIHKAIDLLKSGGVFLLTVNENASDTEVDIDECWAGGPGMAFSHFGLADNLRMLENAGFEILYTFSEREQEGGEPFVWVLCRKT